MLNRRICAPAGDGRPGVAQPQWLHLWLHSPAISKARERSRLRLRPAHTAGVVIADRWVDDLESERTERYRGFESLRFRPSTSTNTEIMITSRPRADAGGCISGGIRATR